MALRLRIDTVDALVQGCKRSADGTSWIVRIFGFSGEDCRVSLTWTNIPPIMICRCDLREQSLERLGSEVDVPAWDFVTLRIEALAT
jgi:alpha-mannosidase